MMLHCTNIVSLHSDESEAEIVRISCSIVGLNVTFADI